jgi:release factor glutamine methyltransferase
VFAEDEARLLIDGARTAADLSAMVESRAAGTPLEQVLGQVEFCGLTIRIGPGVFVPRRRTEFLVSQAVVVAPPRPVVVDLCCGSGAIGCALAALIPDVELYAVDVDPVAVRWAGTNLAATNGQVFRGDLFDPLPGALAGRVDVVTANAPYVPTGSLAYMPAEARDHEPRVALDGGPDGLDVQRRVAAGAPGWLRPGGHLLIEVSEPQAVAAAELLAGSGLTPRVVISADSGTAVVVATRPLPDGYP